MDCLQSKVDRYTGKYVLQISICLCTCVLVYLSPYVLIPMPTCIPHTALVNAGLMPVLFAKNP